MFALYPKYVGRWHIDAREQCVEDSKQKEVEGAALMSLIELLVKLRIKKKKKGSNQVESKNLGYIMNC